MIIPAIKKIFDYQKDPDFNLLKEIVHELIINNKTLNENVCGLSLLHVKAPVKNIKYLLDRGAFKYSIIVKLIFFSFNSDTAIRLFPQ